MFEIYHYYPFQKVISYHILDSLFLYFIFSYFSAGNDFSLVIIDCAINTFFPLSAFHIVLHLTDLTSNSLAFIALH